MSRAAAAGVQEEPRPACGKRNWGPAAWPCEPLPLRGSSKCLNVEPILVHRDDSLLHPEFKSSSAAKGQAQRLLSNKGFPSADQGILSDLLEKAVPESKQGSASVCTSDRFLHPSSSHTDHLIHFSHAPNLAKSCSSASSPATPPSLSLASSLTSSTMMASSVAFSFSCCLSVQRQDDPCEEQYY
ncbi:hypothetical protein H920_05928 [Fukomys damarensis]|uniref:Uncharacterized protein n=1 Tax=Fukomys damarensis TaxID=885580 RepID=A0A091DKX8_FUKDA|nr:hypothetical protein H920_05928 [Fukomys damarensis]